MPEPSAMAQREASWPTLHVSRHPAILHKLRILRDETARVQHTLDVRSDLDAVLISVSEADTAVRSFLPAASLRSAICHTATAVLKMSAGEGAGGPLHVDIGSLRIIAPAAAADAQVDHDRHDVAQAPYALAEGDGRFHGELPQGIERRRGIDG